MLTNIMTEGECSLLRSLIAGADSIVLCCHQNADGDALGAMLGWGEVLRQMGKEPLMVVPDQYPDYLLWLPNTEKIVRYDKRRDYVDTVLKIADLVFCLDFNSAQRTDEMAASLCASPAKKVLIEGLPKGICLNVNFPKRCEEPMKGIKVCRQAACRWVEYFKEQYDEKGEQYYNLDGTFESDDIVPDTDLWALQNNYASLVPTCFDWTAHSQIELMKEFENITIDARLRDTKRETMDSPVSRSPVSHVK